MADEKKDDAPAGESAPKKSPPPLGLILGLLNTLALLGVVGLLVYTKLIYKRPVITETTEREKIEAENAKAVAPSGEKVLVKLDPIQANLKPTRIGAQTPGGPPAQLQPHFVAMNIAFEINDPSREMELREKSPKFLDQILRSLGNTTVEELATVQGRFILRSKLIGVMNELVKRNPGDPPLVTNVYFADFMVQ